MATFTGHPGQDHRWTDLSLLAVERRRREMEIPARALATIDRSRLPPADQLDHDVFKREVEEGLEGRRFRAEFMPLTQMNGVQQDVAQILAMMPAAERRALRERPGAAGGRARAGGPDHRAHEGGAGGGPHPAARDPAGRPAAGAEPDRGRPRESPLLRAFARFPESIPAAEASGCAERAAAAYAAHVAPAYRRLLRVPGGRLHPGRPGVDRHAGAARRRGLVRLERPAVHDHHRSPRTRSTTSGWPRWSASAPAWTSAIAATGFAGHLPRLRALPAHRPAVLLRDAPRSCSPPTATSAKRADPELVRAVRPPAAPALRREAGARLRREVADHRLLQARLARRGPARLLLRQHLRPAQPPELGDGGAGPARGGARPPPADRAGPGDGGPARVPPARPLHRLRRGLGPVRGEPGRRRWASTPTRTRCSAA